MKCNSLRTWASVAAIGILAGACNDEQSGQAPVVPDVPHFTVDVTAPDVATPVNGALWRSAYPPDLGFEAFLDIQSLGSEEGFNTDASPLPLNDTRFQVTKPLPLNKVPVVNLDGVIWRELILNANESTTLPAGQFSIDLFDIWVCHDDNAPTYATVGDFENSSLCSKAYNITDNGKAPLLAADAEATGNAGDLDYRILIPFANFGDAANTACAYDRSAAACGYYVLAHLKMGFTGGDWVTEGTFEEMSTLIRPAVSISKTPNSQTLTAGSPMTFTIEVNSVSGGDVTGVVVTDTLQGGPGVSWSTATAGCAVAGNPQVLTCSFGTLAEGTSRAVTVTSPTTTSSCAVYDNRAWLGTNEGSGGNDSGQITVTGCNGTLTVIKNTQGGDGSFNFAAGGAPLTNFTLATAGGTATTGAMTVPAGTYTVSEQALASGWSFVSVACAGNGAGGTTSSTSSQTATVVVGVGANVVCTFTNLHQAGGSITVVKNTVGGDSTFAFTHDMPGATPASPFTVTTSGGTQSVTFSNVPAGTYHVSETGPSGSWQFSGAQCTTGGTVSGQTATVVLSAGGNVTCTFTNAKLVSGAPRQASGPRGIGYWKNWSSCAQSVGMQYTMAVSADPSRWNETLDGNLPQTLGSLTLHGASAEGATAVDCLPAVNILNKRGVDGVAHPGDPVYNLAAQLLAALLNRAAGAGSCAGADAAISSAQALLTALSFDGDDFYSVSAKTMTWIQADDAGSLASALASYNAATFGGGCP